MRPLLFEAHEGTYGQWLPNRTNQNIRRARLDLDHLVQLPVSRVAHQMPPGVPKIPASRWHTLEPGIQSEPTSKTRQLHMPIMASYLGWTLPPSVYPFSFFKGSQ